MILFDIFNLLFVNPVINGLLAVYHILIAAQVPYALGFSIIVFTVIIRLLLAPLTASQLRTSKKMSELNPQLSSLKERYKDDPKKLQQETMALYKKHGVNPLGGCLPAILQIILFYALYLVLTSFVHADAAKTVADFNKVVYLDFLRLEQIGDTSFFGLPLGKSPSELLSTLGVGVLLVPLITAVLQLIQSKMMFPPRPKEAAAKKKDEPDFQSIMQTQMIYLIPVTIGFAAFSFPLGLSLYWNTFSIFAIIQQYKLQGWGGLAPWIEKVASKK